MPTSLLAFARSQFQVLWIFASLNHGAADDFESPELTTSMTIGITVAIAGNVLIALALNLQKLAHSNVSRRGTALENDNLERTSFDEHDDVFRERLPVTPRRIPPENQNLLQSTGARRNYGSGSRHSPADRQVVPKTTLASRVIPLRIREKLHNVLGVGRFREEDDRIRSQRPEVTSNGNPARDKRTATSQQKSVDEESESDYLKSKLWWLGFLLMNVGELGNFISYAFAPASVVAPLGTFALMANCIFAPLMQGERFRKMDFVGIFIATIGAVTVVLSSNTSDVRLDPDALVQAISQRPFIIFSCVYIIGAIVLAALSRGRTGRNWVFIDVGLCALFGGFTVLSTKAVSTLLTMEWIEMFTKWIIYPVILVLVFTGVGQVRYLNRALMRFDSKVVIPIQFVLFTLSAIIGSAVLYGDFKKATFHQLVTFFYGCIATFLGVFIIAWVPAYDSCHEDVTRKAGQTSRVSFSPGRVRTAGDERSGETPRGVSSGGVRTTGDERSGFGSLGRNRGSLLRSVARDTPSVRRRQSLVGIGISPAQHLLLVQTPPRETPDRWGREPDPERDSITNTDPLRLRRALSWFDEGTRRRDSSIPREGDEGMVGWLE